MKDVAQKGEGASTVAWGYGLKAVPDGMEQLTSHIQRMATAATDDLPVNAAVRESMLRCAQRLHAVTVSSQGWFKMIRNTPGTKEYFDAYETPRDGSLHKEAKSDTV